MTMRLRTKGAIEDVVRTNRETAFNGSVSTTTSTPSHLRSGSLKTTIDVVTPGFHRKQKAGKIVNSPFHTFESERAHFYSGYKVRRKTGSGSTVQYYEADVLYSEPPGVPSLSISTPLRDLAGTEAAANVLKPDLEGLVEIAEFREAIQLFNIRRLVLDKHLRGILRDLWWKHRVKSSVGLLSDYWLKYRYGIMPLVNSCTKALQIGKKPRPVRMTARGSASDSVSRTDVVTSGGSFYNCDFTVNQTMQVDVRAGVLYEIYTDHNRYGFSFSEVPAAVWETIPFSFILDWGANVGSFIRSITPKAGIRVLSTWTTTRMTRTSQWVLDSTFVGSPSTFENIQSPSGSALQTYSEVHRSPGISKALRFDLPSFKAIPTDKRILDAFALTMQLFLK
jgi:hypothetical protein